MPQFPTSGCCLVVGTDRPGDQCRSSRYGQEPTAPCDKRNASCAFGPIAQLRQLVRDDGVQCNHPEDQNQQAGRPWNSTQLSHVGTTPGRLAPRDARGSRLAAHPLDTQPVGGIVALARRKVWAFREAEIGTFLDAWKPCDVAGVIAVLAAEEYRRMPRRSGRRGSWVWSATSVPAVARQRLCG